MEIGLLQNKNPKSNGRINSKTPSFFDEQSYSYNPKQSDLSLTLSRLKSVFDVTS